jgi:16S rRNA (cytidine1402-2'-O)-methyltransferase
MPGTLFVVATPIGNLDDITLRALRVLRDVTIIAAEDTRRTAHLLARHAIATPTTSLHEHNETKKTGAIVARLLAGDSVALVSDAGTPTVSDPGVGLIRAALDAGVRVEPIPGPNAAIAALSVSGLPTESFTFLGFPPTRPKARQLWLHELASVPGTAVFYESPHRIKATLGDLTNIIGDRTIVIGRELTKINEELVRGPISTVISRLSSERGEFTVVIEIGHRPENELANATRSVDSRRETIASLAKHLGVSANELYRVVEQLRNRSNNRI